MKRWPLAIAGWASFVSLRLCGGCGGGDVEETSNPACFPSIKRNCFFVEVSLYSFRCIVSVLVGMKS